MSLVHYLWIGLFALLFVLIVVALVFSLTSALEFRAKNRPLAAVLSFSSSAVVTGVLVLLTVLVGMRIRATMHPIVNHPRIVSQLKNQAVDDVFSWVDQRIKP